MSEIELRVDEHEARLARIAEGRMRMRYAGWKIQEACRNVRRYRAWRERQMCLRRQRGCPEQESRTMIDYKEARHRIMSANNDIWDRVWALPTDLFFLTLARAIVRIMDCPELPAWKALAAEVEGCEVLK